MMEICVSAKIIKNSILYWTEETLITLIMSKWFSSLDHLDKKKAALTAYLGLFEFDQISFGLCNAPSISTI